MGAESLEQMQARHRRELKDLQGRITSKKKNATKKTRKGVNDECAEMERQVRARQAGEMAAPTGPPVDGGESLAHGAAGSQDEAENEDTRPGAIGRIEDMVEEKLEKAAEKMDLTSLHDRASAAVQTQQQQQHDHHHHHHQHQQTPAATGAGGKKRNRQKERAARRAAEQEAAAQRAEEEASHMTDNRARESAYMRKMFKAYGLVEKEVEPDGHCLFSAVADQLQQAGVPLQQQQQQQQQSPPPHPHSPRGGAEPAYRTVRRAAATYMAENPDEFAPFLVDEDLDSYAGRVRDTAMWGGQLELTALARRYLVSFNVIQDGRMVKIGGDDTGAGDASRPVLWLAYYRHGYGLGEHYNSLRKG